MTSQTALDLADMRVSYSRGDDGFDVANLVAKEPFTNFKHWFDAMRESKMVHEPNAMCLSTATKSGRPSSRMVLLKGFDETGFKFFTNYDSRKGS
jgi:pyridoxamine 5'-phosphate oxidase